MKAESDYIWRVLTLTDHITRPSQNDAPLKRLGLHSRAPVPEREVRPPPDALASRGIPRRVR